MDEFERKYSITNITVCVQYRKVSRMVPFIWLVCRRCNLFKRNQSIQMGRNYENAHRNGCCTLERVGIKYQIGRE